MPLRDAITSGKKNVTQALTGKKGEQLTVSSVCVCVCVCVCACVCVRVWCVRVYFIPPKRLLLTEQNNKCNARDQASDVVPWSYYNSMVVLRK